MAEYNVSTGRARLATVIRTREPYVLFQDRIDSGYVVNLRYLSKNKGTDSSGATEVLNFTSRTEIPILDERYHRLIMLCAGKFISGELKNLRNPDGTERYPGMSAAYEYYVTEYETQLQKDKDEATHRNITRNPVSFGFAGAEIGIWSRGY